MRDGGEENASAVSTHVTGSDMRRGHCGVWVSGAPCLGRWNLSWLHNSLYLLDLTIHGGFAVGGRSFEPPWRRNGTFVVFV